MKKNLFIVFLLVGLCAGLAHGGQEEIIYSDSKDEVNIDGIISVQIVKIENLSSYLTISVKVTNIMDVGLKSVKLNCILYDISGEILNLKEKYVVSFGSVLDVDDYGFSKFMFSSTNKESVEKIGFKIVSYGTK